MSEKNLKDAKPTFEFGGKKYVVIIPAARFPELGTLTAADIAADKDAQAFLVKNNCIGSIIEEVV